MVRKVLILAAFSLCCANAAYADDDDCAQTCPDDQVNVGFLDGSHGTCVCMPKGEGMHDVTPEVSEGDEGTNGTYTE